MRKSGILIKTGHLVPYFLISAFGVASLTPVLSESVRVDFGWLHPLENKSDNLTILDNSAPQVHLSCAASYPTEWVMNVDLQNVSAINLDIPGRKSMQYVREC